MRLASASGEREDLGFCLISIGYVSKNVALTCVYVRWTGWVTGGLHGTFQLDVEGGSTPGPELGW
jgi:hypothetical protein